VAGSHVTEFLHPRTIALAVVIVSMSTGVLLLLAARRNHAWQIPLAWGCGNLLASLGTAMVMMRGYIPEFYTIALGNGLIILGYMVNFAGVLMFCRRRVPWLLVPVPAVLWLLLCQWPAFGQSVEWRLIGASLAVVIASFGCALVLAGLRDENLATRRTAIAWYSFHGVVFVIRMIPPLLSTQPASSEINASPIVVIVMMEALVHATVMTFLLLSLLKDRAEERYRRAAETDVLTGQPNRRAFMAEAERLVTDTTRWPACMLVIDVDRFKSINDTVGHAGGDAVLVTVASTIRSHLRPADTFGRLGGEEFGALLPNTTLASAMTLAEGLRARVAALDIAAGGTTLRTTVSIGVSMIAGGKPDLDTLIDRADACLYEAKRTGRNRVVAREDGVRLAG